MGITSFSTMSDVLASEGVIDYDANAFVKGTKPKFVGRPTTYANSGVAYPVTAGIGIYSNPYQRMLTQTYSGGYGDAFLRSASMKNNSQLHNIDKRKLGLFGIIGATGLFILNKINPKVKAFNKNIGTKVSGLLGKIKGNSTVEQVSEKAEAVAKKVKLPKNKKIAIIVASVLGLLGISGAVVHSINNRKQAGENPQPVKSE